VAIIRERVTPGPNADSESSTPSDEDFSDSGQRPDGRPDFSIIIGAPDLAELIKRPSTRRSREYRDKVGSLLRIATVGSLQTGNFPDAATLLWYGPSAATALGNLCDSNKTCAYAVDMLTTPSSPLAECLVTLLPLASQLIRNHESQLADVPTRFNWSREARAARKQARAAANGQAPTFTIRAFGKKIPVRWHSPFPRMAKNLLGGLRSQTREPNHLAASVFTDPKVIQELRKMGVNIQTAGDGDAG